MNNCDNDQECKPFTPGTITPSPLPIPEGGGGGTSDFNQLTNLPKYGGVKMSGSTDIPNIEGLIPSTATSANKLADQAFVNSSVATNTAYFVGTFNTIEELEAVENPSNNDYGFVVTTDSAGNTVFNRYKFNSDTNVWVWEYSLNNSSFTAAQWAAIQSGITSEGVNKLRALALIESIGEGLSLENNELAVDKSLIGKARVLTKADYNYPVNNPTGIAMWLLEPGLYSLPIGVVGYTQTYFNTPQSAFSGTWLVTRGFYGNDSASGLYLFNGVDRPQYYTAKLSDGSRIQGQTYFTEIVDNLTDNFSTRALSARQGKVLNEKIGGDLSNLDTTDKTSLINAINELAAKVATLEGN